MARKRKRSLSPYSKQSKAPAEYLNCFQLNWKTDKGQKGSKPPTKRAKRVCLRCRDQRRKEGPKGQAIEMLKRVFRVTINKGLSQFERSRCLCAWARHWLRRLGGGMYAPLAFGVSMMATISWLELDTALKIREDDDEYEDDEYEDDEYEDDEYEDDEEDEQDGNGEEFEDETGDNDSG
ncbi:hypothetical protein B0H66DRAFT_605420 [Apodospora peruviana]|uniref:Uncharacterized protein n=1 Tax=Apodospora peruviana TaxID=516989 RepID=A0AAE0HXL1_9PEZI|nr:hypothetical protein B0H66DRAFT_605420 [Apodospora peruviana]